MTNPFPIIRQTREADPIVGDGGATYGPFSFKIWDPADVVAVVRRTGSDWSTEACTVQKVADRAFDDFRITFSPPLAPADVAVIRSQRLQDRLSDVTRGGAISAVSLERELSIIATVLQELRRDLNVGGFTGGPIGGGGGGGGAVGIITIGDVRGLVQALAGKAQATHGHKVTDVAGLDNALVQITGAINTIVQSRGQTNGLAPLGADGLVPAQYLPVEVGGGDAANNASNIYYYPTPTVAVPVAQRLGQEVFLTDGYEEGSFLEDFSDLIAENLARAVTTKRPFIVPHGDFRATRRFAFSDTGIFMHGYGKGQSAIVWGVGAVSTGLRFAARREYLRPDHMHFSDFMLLTQKAAEGTALECDFGETVNTVFNPNDPTIFDRHSTRFVMEDVSIRGATRETVDGWLRGVDVFYPIDAMFNQVHVVGLVTNASDPQTILSESGLYAGAVNGRGHPTGTYYDDCNIFNVRRAVVSEGCEGMVARGNQLVNVHSGLRFQDPLGRPLLQATNNHINAHGVCIAAEAASQIQIIGNSLYHTLGTDRDGIGVSVAGPSQHANIIGNCFESAIGSTKIFTGVTIFRCDHGVIDGNTFRPGALAGQAPNMKGIVLGAGARFFKIGQHNVFEDPQGGRTALISSVEDGGQENRLPAKGARYSKYGGQYVSGETVIGFDASEGFVGGVESMSDGAFTVPVTGFWTFTFGVVAGPSYGGQILAIKKNGLGTTALVSDSKDYQGSTPIAMHVTTGPILVNKGDTLYPVFNSPGTTVNAHPATFFEARRLY